MRLSFLFLSLYRDLISKDVLTYPGLDQGYEGPYGDAGDGGGGKDATSPLSPGRIGVHCAIILLNGEL